MKYVVAFFLALVSLPSFAQDPFPTSPDARLTPGSLCRSARNLRYNERIPYCARDVESELKVEIIRVYDTQLGYHIGSMDRQLFKIDHFIPLCMGGSNNPDNLWPQHHSVFELTDKLEQEACLKMSAGRLLQRDAVELIRRAKLNLSEVPAVQKYIDRL